MEVNINPSVGIDQALVVLVNERIGKGSKLIGIQVQLIVKNPFNYSPAIV